MEKRKPRLKILVACHKADHAIRQDDNYMPIQVGKALHPELNLGFQCDNTGDNISEKNGSYCELTALYWAWKNLRDVEYIGLCHYRRYFNFRSKSCAVKNVSRDCIHSFNGLEINAECLKPGEVILQSFNYLPYSVKCDFQNTVLAQDIYILYKIILKYSPDYSGVLEKYLTGNRRSGFNMFIMDRARFSEYCDWLFMILGKLENSVRLTGYTSYKRLFGYMGEILLPVYCMKNRLKIRERQLIFVDEAGGGNRFPGIKQVRNLLNRAAFRVGNVGRSQKIQDDYWDLYLKIDDIKI